jgi:polyhydroxyalkanoate synthase
MRGLQNVARDARDNHGMPRSVDRSAFTVGKNLAATPGAVVHASEPLELLQYYPTTATVQSRPVVVVPPQINKYYVMDLAPGRSFVEYAVAQGFLVFVVSWRDVTAAQRHWGLDVYVDALADALRVAATIAKTDDTAVVGVCAGGLTTAALLGLLAARGEALVPAAAFGVTHLDYSLPSTLGMMGTPEIVGRATRSSGRSGVIDRRALSAMFALLRPNDLVWNYWVRNNLLGEAPPAFDVLAWNADSTCLSARLHEDFLDIFLNNTLARGDLSVQGVPVDLAKTDCDVLFMGAASDHLVPWKACYASAELFGGSREFVLSSSGHIQSLVNPPGSPKMSISFGDQAGLDADEWLATAKQTPGVWWERWATWQKARSGPDRRAPSQLGDRAHPPTVPAPGRYVLGA